MSSGGEPTPAVVLQALQTLYYDTDSEKKREANNWLQDFQRLPQAWMVADQLLNAPDIPTEVQVFGAQTLRRKIVADLAQLDSNSAMSLCESVLTLLSTKYVAGPRVITTQLCVSAAALALQLPQWTDPYQRMFEMFGDTKLDEARQSIFIEFLTVLPEEVRSTNAPAPSASVPQDFLSMRTMQLITQHAADVLAHLLGAVQATQNSDLHNRILACLVSWIRYNDIQFEHFSKSPLLAMTLMALQSDDLFDNASDLFCEMTRECTGADPGSPFIDQLCSGLGSLGPMVEACFGEDEEKQRNLCRMFAETGETFLSQIIENPERFAAVLQGLLRCTAFSDLDVVPITFEFWYELTMAIKDQPHDAFVPTFQLLLDTMMRHLRFPADMTTLTAKERDDFRSFRHDMGDVMKDCFAVLGEQETLSRAAAQLQTHLANAATPWQDIEAVLFAFRALGSQVSRTEAVYIPQVMQAMANLPNHPKLRYASILVYGRYSDWTAEHPDTIPFQLQLISSGFDDPEVTSASALALKHICESCGPLMVSFLPQLQPFYVTLSERLHVSELKEMTEAMAHIIRHVPLDQLSNVLGQFIQPLAVKLSNAVKAYPASDPTAGITAIEALFLQLNEHFKVIRPDVSPGQPHPCIDAFQQFIPTIDSVLAVCDAVQISETVCKLLKNCLISYDLHCTVILPWMMNVMVTMYQQRGHSCYLWLASHVVRRLGRNQELPAQLRTSMVDAVNQLTALTLQRYTTSAQCDENPGVIDDFSRMMYATLAHLPSAVFNQQVFMHILQFCLIGLSAAYASTVESCGSLLRDIFAASIESSNNGQNNPDAPHHMLVAVLPGFMPALLDVVMIRIVGLRSVVPYNGDVFVSLSRVFCYMMTLSSAETVCTGMDVALTACQAQEPKFTENMKCAFISDVHSESSNPERIRYAIASLSCSIRGRSRRNSAKERN